MGKFGALLLTVLAAGQGACMESTTRSDYIVEFWDETLRKMGEPPLPALVTNDGSVFRALLDVSFESQMVFRIDVYPDGRPARLTHVVNLGDGGPSLARREVRERDLSASEMAKFRAAFDRIRICGSGPDPRIGLDGWTWVFEFANATRYCAVGRWAPENDPYAALGDLLQNLVR